MKIVNHHKMWPNNHSLSHPSIRGPSNRFPVISSLSKGIDSQHIKYCKASSSYELDPRLRLGPAERALVSSMLEMGWLFKEVDGYINGVDGARKFDTLEYVMCSK